MSLEDSNFRIIQGQENNFSLDNSPNHLIKTVESLESDQNENENYSGNYFKNKEIYFSESDHIDLKDMVLRDDSIQDFVIDQDFLANNLKSNKLSEKENSQNTQVIKNENQQPQQLNKNNQMIYQKQQSMVENIKQIELNLQPKKFNSLVQNYDQIDIEKEKKLYVKEQQTQLNKNKYEEKINLNNQINQDKEMGQYQKSQTIESQNSQQSSVKEVQQINQQNLQELNSQNQDQKIRVSIQKDHISSDTDSQKSSEHDINNNSTINKTNLEVLKNFPVPLKKNGLRQGFFEFNNISSQQGIQKTFKMQEAAKFIEEKDNKQQQEKQKQKYFKEKFAYVKLKNTFLNKLYDTPSRRFKCMNETHFQFLNDLSFFYQEDNVQQRKLHQFEIIFDKYQRKIVKFLTVNHIWKPEGLLVFIYDILSAVFIVFWMFIFTFHLCFGAFDILMNYPMQIIQIISNIFFASEFIFRFQIGFYSNGSFIKDKKLIALRYKDQSMKYDVLGFLALTYNYYDNSINFWSVIFELVFFLKYKTLQLTVQRIEEALYTKGIKSHHIELIKMLCQLQFLCHIIASIWYLLSEYQIMYQNEEESWKQVIGLQGKHWFKSFYWALATVMLVGSKGETPLETLFTCFTLLLTVGVFAYIISKISMIIEELNQGSQEYKRDLEIINRYMENKEIEKQLKSKVRSFLEYVYKASGETDISKKAVNVIDSKLPRSMKEQIQTQINENIIQKFPFMWNNFSQKTLDDLLLIMEEQTCVTNEYIFQQGEPEDPCLFLIIKGQVDITFQTPNNSHKEFVIAKLKAGDVAGDVNLVTGIQYQYSAKCSTFVNVCRIKRSLFIDILKRNQDDFERFCYIKEEFKFRHFSNYFHRQCLCCQKPTHTETTCNLLVYRPNSYSVNMKTNYLERWQDRLRFKRYDNVNFRPLSDDLLYELDIVREKLYLDQDFLEYQEKVIEIDDSEDEDEEYYEYIQEQENILNKPEDIANLLVQNKPVVDKNGQVVKSNLKKKNQEMVNQLISDEQQINQNNNKEKVEIEENNSNYLVQMNQQEEQTVAINLIGGDSLDLDIPKNLNKQQTLQLVHEIQNNNDLNNLKQSIKNINLQNSQTQQSENNTINQNKTLIQQNDNWKMSQIPQNMQKSQLIDQSKQQLQQMSNTSIGQCIINEEQTQKSSSCSDLETIKSLQNKNVILEKIQRESIIYQKRQSQQRVSYISKARQSQRESFKQQRQSIQNKIDRNGTDINSQQLDPFKKRVSVKYKKGSKCSLDKLDEQFSDNQSKKKKSILIVNGRASIVQNNNLVQVKQQQSMENLNQKNLQVERRQSKQVRTQIINNNDKNQYHFQIIQPQEERKQKKEVLIQQAFLQEDIGQSNNNMKSFTNTTASNDSSSVYFDEEEIQRKKQQRKQKQSLKLQKSKFNQKSMAFGLGTGGIGLKSSHKKTDLSENPDNQIEDEVIKLVEERLNMDFTKSFDIQDMIKIAQEQVYLKFFTEFEAQRNYKIYCPQYNLSYTYRIYKVMLKKKKNGGVSQTCFNGSTTIKQLAPVKLNQTIKPIKIIEEKHSETD